MAELAIGAVALLPLVIEISRDLRNAYKSVKYARSELEELTNEMDIFTGLYTAFLKACSIVGKHRNRVSSAKEKLVIWTRRAILDYKKLLHKVDALARDPIYKHTITETAFAHCKWFFRRSHVVYLRASLNVARQSLVSFTNIYNMEILDEQLIRLKSIISRRQREEVEKEYGMTMKEIQAIRNTYELRQYSVPLLLQEAHNKIFAYTKQSKDDGVIEHMRQLRAFSESVARYIDRVLPMDKAGNRPPRLSRRSGARTSRHGQDCSLTSQSTGTISTQSTQSSHYQTQTPESPPTSPEPPIVKPVINVQLEEEKETTSILNFCQRCSGTCTNTKAHNTSIQYTPPEPASHTIWYPPNTAPIPFSIQANGTARPGIRSRPQVRPAVQTQPSNFNAISASSQRPNTHQSYSPKPTVEPADEVRGSPRINPTTPQGDGDEIHDGEPEEEDSIQEQASGSKKSIWQATGGFEGDVPKGLRIRRQRSRSPQDFW